MLHALTLDRTGFEERLADWNALLDRSRTRSVFLRAEWLLTCADALYPDAPLCAVAIVGPDGWKAGGVWVHDSARWSLLGGRTGDVLDVPVDRTLTDAMADKAVRRLFEAAFNATGATRLLIPSVCDQHVLREHLSRAALPCNVVRATVASSLPQHALAAAAGNPDLKRHWDRLHRLGTAEVLHLSDPEDVLPWLPTLFGLDVARCASSGQPSPFERAEQRELYVRLTHVLGTLSALRFTLVRCEQEPIACHFGMHWGGRYSWHRPAAAPSAAEHAPTEILLRALLLRAEAEGAQEFDFSTANEALTFRLATITRQVEDLAVWRSPGGAFRERSYLRARELAKRWVPGLLDRPLG